jgi:ABC-type dipeptide/oligopeptide/nickel transport system ATPase component
MKSPPLLEIRNLSVSFNTDLGNLTVVDHVSFILNESETLAVVGESGSGKTVTALAVLRLIPMPPGLISNGEIMFRNGENPARDILRLDEHVMQQLRGRSISMIFQEPMTSLNPVFTCGNQVMESLRSHLGFVQ